MNFENLQKRKRLRSILHLMAMALCITVVGPQAMNAQINADGNEHTVDAIGQTLDISLPNNPNIAFITFRLVGGDGGYAQVLDHIGKKTVKANGGSGAYITAIFPVGNGPNEIPPGSIFRFMEGKSGENGSSDAILGTGYDYGGGGGGSGILYKENSTSPYKLLVVAGGGGGAYQGMVAGTSVDHKPGQSGRTGTSGGSGNGGDLSNAGGIDGHDGGDKSVGDGGGARTESSSIRTSAYTHENCDDCVLPGLEGFGIDAVWRAGGTGYGCGGHGLGSLYVGSGGGGGGYSGGGFGGTAGRGGGGGSYVNPIATLHSSSDQGTDPTPDHGWITYQVTLNQQPEAKCKESTIYLDENGMVTLYPSDVDNGSTDPDGTIAGRSLSKTSMDCGDIGPNQVTLTVTDNMGSTASCTATVNIMDARPPVAECQNITVYLDANGEASIGPEDVDNGSSDNCGIASMNVVPNSFTCLNVGEPVEVTLIVKDGSANQRTCTSMVTVLDTVSPVAKCQNLTVLLDTQGIATIEASDLDNGSTDACGISILSIDQSVFTCTNVGENMVVLTVTDNNGNSNTCTSMVTVADNIPPVAKCENITIQLDANGNASITGTDIDSGSNDACGIASITPSKTSFTCADVGANKVILTVTDNNGNTSTCTSTVTVEENVPPEVLCMDIIIQLDEQGHVSIVATDIDNGSHDACGIASYVVSKTDFTCTDLGNNTVTLTVTDVNDNSANCYANVRIEDNIAPIVRTQDVTVILDRRGNGRVTPNMIDNGCTDNCFIVDMWLEGQVAYDCGDEGVHEVQLKVEDQSGNVGTGYAQVTVKFYEPNFTNIHGVANGDTMHLADCLPLPISNRDLVNYQDIQAHATVSAHRYREELPEDASWSMYELWRYVYRVEDACAFNRTFTFYLALYDLAPPSFHSFPNDTVVATVDDVPEIDEDVRIIDVCLYVVWDTVVTMPVLDQSMTDTIGYIRRWIARDPVGHESFKDQMIWLGSGDRDQYSLITGRIAGEDHIANAKFAGEAGMNGIPVNLYRLDTAAGTRTWVNSWTTGDWMGEQGKYYFVPEQPGSYQVKIDTAICLVDTVKFNKWLWSDTLKLAGGEPVDQGWIVTYDCVDETDTAVVGEVGVPKTLSEMNDVIQGQVSSNTEWRVYPNPAFGYLKIDINPDDAMNYRIYDALGRSVKTGVYHHRQTIDLRGLNTGLYYLQLWDQKEILGTKRVLLSSDF